MSKKGTRYQSRARAILYSQGAINVLTSGGTGYSGGVDLFAIFPAHDLAVQVKACHQDRKGNSAAANQAMREGVEEITKERLPDRVRREVWVFRRGAVVISRVAPGGVVTSVRTVEVVTCPCYCHDGERGGLLRTCPRCGCKGRGP